MILLKLVLRDFLRRKSMLGFAFLAIVAVCCLIVWFVGSIDTSAMSQNSAKDYFGKYTAALCSNTAIPDDVFDAVRRAGGTLRVTYGFQKPAVMTLENFPKGLKPGGMGDRRSPALFGLGVNASPFELTQGRWFANPMECVAGEAAEKLLTAVPGETSPRKLNVGDRIQVRTDEGVFHLTVVGLFEQHALPEQKRGGPGGTFAFGFGLGLGGGTMGGGTAPRQQSAPRQPPQMRGNPFRRTPPVTPLTPAVYVSLDDAGTISGDPLSLNVIAAELEDGVSEDAFYANVEKELGRTLAEAGLRTADTRPPKKSGAESVSPGMVLGQAWSAVGLVLLASILIIFTTLSMGVGEKVRQLAMLRTIGFTKTRVAALILLQGVILGLFGWIAGLASGQALITLLLSLKAGVYVPVSLTAPCVLFAFCCSLAGSLLASIVPAWRATCVSPAESMVRKTHNLTPKQLTLCGLTGLFLLSLIPGLVFLLPCDVKTKLLLFTTLGTFLLGAGFLLFFPWTLVLTEKLFGPAAARLFGFHPRFLANVLTGNQWRTLGTTVSMSIGLGLFTAIHIWCASMLSMFTVPDTIPDTLVRFQEGVISDVTEEAVKSFPGLRADRLMRLAVAQPALDAALAEKMREAKAMASNLVTFGVDTRIAWRETDPLLRLKFVEGSPAKTREAFEKPGSRACVIPETLSVHGNLHVGDTLRLEKSNVRAKGGRPGADGTSGAVEYAEYTVAGVVDFAWVWLSKCAGVRVSEGRTAGTIFVPFDAVLEDFGAPDGEFFWFDTVPGTTYAELNDYMRNAAKNAADAHPPAPGVKSFSGGTLWDSGLNKYFVQVSSVESLNNSLNFRADGVIDTMARMPLIILILSTIAVLNTMVVSVRARRWEMGVFRACGVTRGGLVRMILAESLLIGLCACVMSFSFGVFYAWIASAMVEFAPVFGVIAPSLVIPWGKLLSGYVLALGVCMAAGMIPAFSAGFREVSELLQRKD